MLVRRIPPLIFLLMCSSSLSFELYNDNKTSVSTRGWIRYGMYKSDAIDEMVNAGSRVGFDLSRHLDEGWKLGGQLEWGLDFERNSGQTLNLGNLASRPNDSEGDAFFTRLANISLSHEELGKFTMGKQWAVYNDPTQVTDVFLYWGTHAGGSFNLGGDGGLSGVGRAEQALTYRQQWGGFKLGLQYQSQEEPLFLEVDKDPDCSNLNASLGINLVDCKAAELGNGYGVALGYDFANSLTLGFAYNVSDIDLVNDLKPFVDTGDDVAAVVSFSYGRVNEPGLYVGALYSETENHEIDNLGIYYDAKGIELALMYGVTDRFTLYTGLNTLEPNDSNYIGDYKYSYTIVGVSYLFLGEVKFFIETNWDESKAANGSKLYDDAIIFGFEYSLFQ